jgi:hypothetical protein
VTVKLKLAEDVDSCKVVADLSFGGLREKSTGQSGYAHGGVAVRVFADRVGAWLSVVDQARRKWQIQRL